MTNDPPDPASDMRLARHAMRTRFELVLADGGDPAAIRAAGEEALDEIERCEALLSAHRDDAELFSVNARAGQEPVRVDPRLMAFLLRVKELAHLTDGAFDPSAGALVGCWRAAGERGEIPDHAVLASALEACDMDQVLLDQAAGTVRFARPAMRLDPGAVGKGYALERAAGLLREHGLRDALLHGGTSTVTAIGPRTWPVAIRHPQRADATIATAMLSDRSLSVSAGHGRAFTVAGTTYGHVIDPRDGLPVRGHLLAAVMHPSAMASDALSTALLVMGEAGLATLPGRFPTASWLLVQQRGQEIFLQTLGSGFVEHPPAEKP